jgi:hypothetical protein
MTGSIGTPLFRIAFALAGCYNLAFGMWVVFWPLQFFELFGIAFPRYPAIWACLGMVVGIYGLLYWHAAWKPEYGRPIIAIGLLGKVLGPIGMVISFSDEWPRRLAMLNLYNDVIWWLPFTLFLLRGTRLATRLAALAPWCCAGLHALGLAAMGLVLRQGMLTEPEALQRATYIAQHSTLWTVGWGIWMLAAVSLVAFYVWWGSQISAPLAATVGVLVAALGSVFDLSGESLSVLVLVERSQVAQEDSMLWDHAGFEFYERAVTLLTAGAANLLYTLGGLVLMLWTVDLPRRIRLAMWGTWISGVGMTLAAVFNHVGGMVAMTIMLFPLLIAWTIWMGRYWRRE